MSSRIARMRIPFFEDQAERAADAIRRGQLVHGPHLETLQSRLAALFGRRYVTLTCNGFAAIFAALAAVGGGMAVRTAAASTCHAVTNAIRASRRPLELVDIEEASASIAAHQAGPLAVVPDHFGLIAGACREWTGQGGCLIEDASQSFMSRTTESTLADVLILSFYPTKLVNGIDGGALLTNDPTLHGRAQKFVQYVDQLESESEPRFNLKLNNVNAAVALASLDHLEAMMTRLRQVFAAYAQACNTRGTRFLAPRGREVASRFIVVADSAEHRARCIAALGSASIQGAGELLMLAGAANAARFPVADRMVATTFSIPFHPLLEDAEVERVIMALERS
jgi:perosamine synthetase